ncbi:MAG: hypothetical protein HYY46_04605 [Deltaproteobacteria bacterium]|nr:hypothetical protein [Deltaproteobacteria bacterium]
MKFFKKLLHRLFRLEDFALTELKMKNLGKAATTALEVSGKRQSPAKGGINAVAPLCPFKVINEDSWSHMGRLKYSVLSLVCL